MENGLNIYKSRGNTQNYYANMHNNFACGKIMEYAEAFRKLVMIYKENDEGALSLQLEETAAMLERLTGNIKEGTDLTNKDTIALRKTLEGCGLAVGRILIFEPVKGHYQLVIDLAKTHRGAITAKDAAGIIGNVLTRKFKVASNSRQVITKEPGEYIFEEEPKFRLLFGHAGKNKGNSRISGDNYTFMNIDGGRNVLGLVDGMGCGKEANEQSTRFIELLEQLLTAGFDEGKAAIILNRVFADNDKDGKPVTLDLCTVNSYDATADFVKMGCAATFIKRKDKVEMVRVSSMPAGVLADADYDRANCSLESGDYIIMMSDGVLDALPFYDKEKKMREIIEAIEEKMPQGIAQRIINEAVFYDENIADDMTVLVTGIWHC